MKLIILLSWAAAVTALPAADSGPFPFARPGVEIGTGPTILHSGGSKGNQGGISGGGRGNGGRNQGGPNHNGKKW
ncbi:hypothetical protein EG328_011971 [Venturia inaequalis]|uniref:Uncharacterized protein n=1 Tax=Venturia inaequalis TaxID=5025 RepID=A0A8H3U452_VENIN|nr:hypothetical protein EG328_011971 [Venturia inaequalis]KAE9968199.1 hypothetical protein EG327_011137 [Venturia inaequalis]RDI80174.1 hypothetical protein Vi05172_g9833 [Venturia inaequalis]